MKQSGLWTPGIWNKALWTQADYDSYFSFLPVLADESYRKFQQGLVPGETSILGIRIPILRKLAQEIAQGDLNHFLALNQNRCYEETMIAGLAIGYSKDSIQQTFLRLEQFVPHISNWAVCDSVCSGLKIFRRNRSEGFSWLMRYRDSHQEFELRFLLVMLLCHYLEEPWIEQVVTIIPQIPVNDYYVMMALSWLTAECCIHFPQQADPLLELLSQPAAKKAVQKIRESRQVSPEEKQRYAQILARRCSQHASSISK